MQKAQADALRKIPGVRVKRGFVLCYPNVASYVAPRLRSAGFSVSIEERPARGGAHIPHSDAAVDEALAASELHYAAWDGGLTLPGGGRFEYRPFAREGVRLGVQLDTYNFWWKPGCLAGDAEIVVNRAGGARRRRLDHLVRKFNGGSVGGERRWRPDIATRTASVDDEGYLRLNDIVAAVESGTKPVWAVHANGRVLKATLDHRFFVADGAGGVDSPIAIPLSNLLVGDLVLMRGTPDGRQPRRRPDYPELRHMWNHPHAAHRRFFRGDRPNQQRKATVPLHRLVAEARLNKLSLDAFVGRIVLNRLDGLEFLDPEEWHVHHRDGDPSNNADSNLEVLPREEHLRQHGEENWRNVTARAVAVPIEAIEELPPEPTYDLSMQSPRNSFVANDFIVHNSGKTSGGLAWALAYPRRPGAVDAVFGGATVIITRAVTRRHFGAEFEKLTTCRPWVSDPGRRGQKSWEAPQTYLLRCAEFGFRPIFVIGWAELSHCVWGVTPELGKPEDQLQLFDGVGAGTARKLLEHFDGDLVDVVTATADELQAIQGIGSRKAEDLVASFRHPDRGDLAARRRGSSSAGFLRDLSIASLVMDEIHNAKSHERRKWGYDAASRRNKATLLHNRVSAAEHISRRSLRRLGMTGTSVPDRLRDLWGPLDLVEPGGWGGYWSFIFRYADAKKNDRGHWDDSGSCYATPGLEHRVEELDRRLDFVRHNVPYSVSHAELPPLRREVLFLSRDQLAVPSEAARNEARHTAIHNNRTAAMLKLACVMKRPEVIRQALEVALEGGKVTIFSGLVLDCDAIDAELRKALQALGRPIGAPGTPSTDKSVHLYLAHGMIDPNDRYDLSQDYLHRRGGAIFTATQDAMGEGIDLQDTDLCLRPMLPWEPRRFEQVERRHHRPGMTRPTTIRYLIAEGTADEVVNTRLIQKIPTVVGAMQDDEMARALIDLQGLGDIAGTIDSTVGRIVGDDGLIDGSAEDKWAWSPEGTELDEEDDDAA